MGLQPAVEPPTAATRAGGGPRQLLVAVGVALLLESLWWFGTPALGSLAPVDPPVYEGDLEQITLEHWGGEDGVHILQYVDGAYATVTLGIRNDGLLPLAIRDLRFASEQLTLATVLDGPEIDLGAGDAAEVTLTVRLDNCEYFHERELEMHVGVTAEVATLGRTWTEAVPFNRPLLVRSPTINRCPDRVLDRLENNRSDWTRR